MLKLPPVKKCLISGIYMQTNTIVGYVVHKYHDPGIENGVKLTLQQIVELITKYGQEIYVMKWDYEQSQFIVADRVYFTQGRNGPYLHLKPYTDKTKNLRHLIGASWFDKIDPPNWKK